MHLYNSFLSIILPYIPENNRIERIWKIAQVDFKKRYYNDRFGLMWALINPLLRVLVYYLAFTYFIPRNSSSGENFALFLFSGLIFWLEFVQTIKKGMKTLIVKSYLIENIKFDKIDLYLSLGLSSFMALVFNIIAFFTVSLFFDPNYNLTALLLPILIVNFYLITIGLALILTAFYIYIKDVVHILDIVILFGFWTSGILFPAEKILLVFPPLYYINPFLGFFHNIRSIFLQNTNIDFTILIVNLVQGIIVFLIGVYLLKKHSHKAMENR